VIPILLWQCPLCHIDDALSYQRFWFRPDEMRCRQCETVWEVKRVIGNDYRLKVVHGEPAILSRERPLAEWYDLMKGGLRLVAKAEDGVALRSGEELYVQSGRVELLAEMGSLLFTSWDEEEAPWQKEGSLGFSVMKKYEVGRLALTSERLIWSAERRTLTFQLRRIMSVHTEVTWYLGVLYGLCRYKFRFREESILKWLTYIALAARRVDQVYHHKISCSNF
jgi:hypothetical protein